MKTKKSKEKEFNRKNYPKPDLRFFGKVDDLTVKLKTKLPQYAKTKKMFGLFSDELNSYVVFKHNCYSSYCKNWKFSNASCYNFETITRNINFSYLPITVDPNFLDYPFYKLYKKDKLPNWNIYTYYLEHLAMAMLLFPDVTWRPVKPKRYRKN